MLQPKAPVGVLSFGGQGERQRAGGTVSKRVCDTARVGEGRVDADRLGQQRALSKYTTTVDRSNS